MEQTMKQIASFTVNHDKLEKGMYISRIDGDVVTYDIRMKKPNGGDYMDNVTMHSMEHMLATFLRNSDAAEDVIYFGPMGCRTGFYLLMRSQNHERALEKVKEALRKTIDAPEMFGASRKECGNYKELSIEAAHKEAARYLKELESREQNFKYPTE